MSERHHPNFRDASKCICGLPMEGHPERQLPAAPRTITEHEMAAGDLHSAATCALSLLVGLNVAEGGRMQFIRGVLKKHAKYGIKADLPVNADKS